MLTSPDEMVFVSLTSTLSYIMSGINAQRGLFMFAITVENSERISLSHRLLGDWHGTVFKVFGGSQEHDIFAVLRFTKP
jgi:hypothetical protein